MKSNFSSIISKTNSVAMGDDFADLILTNCSLVNVYSKEIQEKIQIAITNDRIAFVGPDASHTIGPKTKILDVKHKFVSPSFVDPHIHIGSLYHTIRICKEVSLVWSYNFVSRFN